MVFQPFTKGLLRRHLEIYTKCGKYCTVEKSKYTVCTYISTDYSKYQNFCLKMRSILESFHLSLSFFFSVLYVSVLKDGRVINGENVIYDPCTRTSTVYCGSGGYVVLVVPTKRRRERNHFCCLISTPCFSLLPKEFFFLSVRKMGLCVRTFCHFLRNDLEFSRTCLAILFHLEPIFHIFLSLVLGWPRNVGANDRKHTVINQVLE